MARRPMTHAEALAAWRVDGELRGGHSPQETLSFVDALTDLEDEQDERRRAVPFGAVPADAEPRGLRRIFGR